MPVPNDPATTAHDAEIARRKRSALRLGAAVLVLYFGLRLLLVGTDLLDGVVGGIAVGWYLALAETLLAMSLAVVYCRRADRRESAAATAGADR